jgi:hypothetical protein
VVANPKQRGHPWFPLPPSLVQGSWVQGSGSGLERLARIHRACAEGSLILDQMAYGRAAEHGCRLHTCLGDISPRAGMVSFGQKPTFRVMARRFHSAQKADINAQRAEGRLRPIPPDGLLAFSGFFLDKHSTRA